MVRSNPHFILQCECGAVISQCRCVDEAKPIRVSPAPCDECLTRLRDEIARMSGNDTVARM